MTEKTAYPVQNLVFFLAQDFDVRLAERINAEILDTGAGHDWVIAPPEPIDSFSVGEDDPSVSATGGVLRIYSALGSTQLPKEIDLRHLGEVKFLVERLRRFSEEESIAFEFELDSTYVGEIVDGRLNPSLAVGLIGEWERVLTGLSTH